MCEPLANQLVRQRFAVTQAGSAAKARSRLAADTPDLVLLDIMMPEAAAEQHGEPCA